FKCFAIFKYSGREYDNFVHLLNFGTRKMSYKGTQAKTRLTSSLNTWCNKFSETADKHAPIKTRRVKCTSKSPWITPELTELMRERDYHQKQAHKTNSEYHWQKFRELRNYINNQIKLAKSNKSATILNDFEFKEVDESFILRELGSLKTNKATGLDQISAKLLKDSSSIIASGLTKIINASFVSQTFPDIWKKARLFPSSNPMTQHLLIITDL
ncbi:Hypothetical predicted protein, partial [Paramuricea clavata]